MVEEKVTCHCLAGNKRQSEVCADLVVIWIFMMILEFVWILAVIVADIMSWRIVSTMGWVKERNAAETTDDSSALFSDKENAALRIDQKLDLKRSSGAAVRRGGESAPEIVAAPENANARCRDVRRIQCRAHAGFGNRSS